MRITTYITHLPLPYALLKWFSMTYITAKPTPIIIDHLVLSRTVVSTCQNVHKLFGIDTAPMLSVEASFT